MNIVFLHYPTIYDEPKIPKELKDTVKKISKYATVYNYFFKFSYYKNKFTLADMEFENVSKDIYNNYKDLGKFLLIAVNHACPFALHYSSVYPETCNGVLCYPYRFYSKESYDRRLWKFKDNNGWSLMVKDKKYTMEDYLLNITEERFAKLFNNPQEDEKMLMWLNLDVNLQKQYYKIPVTFTVPTVLYTRFDLDVPKIIEHNYDRKDIAKMKKILTKDDALYNSMIWNFDRVKYDALLKDKNKDNKYLKIKYLVSGWESNQDIIDEVILFTEKNK